MDEGFISISVIEIDENKNNISPVRVSVRRDDVSMLVDHVTYVEVVMKRLDDYTLFRSHPHALYATTSYNGSGYGYLWYKSVDSYDDICRMLYGKTRKK